MRIRFPLILALCIILFQLGMTLLLIQGGGPNNIWMGNTIVNTGDQSVFLNDIEQIRRGALGLQNMFAPENSVPYWHPFYVFVGFGARAFHLSAIEANEVSRWIVTIIAVFCLHAVSQRLTKNERDAKLLTTLIVLAGGFGWIVNAHRSWFHLVHGDIIPDIDSEAFFFPMLLTSGHIALSWALLPITLIRIWDECWIKTSWIPRLGTAALLFFLGLIHPYSLLTICLFIVITVGYRAYTTHRCTVSALLWYAIAGVCASIPHLLMLLLNPTRRFLVTGNVLPIQPKFVWLLAFSPLILFAVWRLWIKAKLEHREGWLLVWAIAIGIGILIPGITWHRKLTEGWSAILIWFGAPTLFWIRDRSTPALRVALCLLLFLTPLGMLKAQVDYAYGLAHTERRWLYTTPDLYASWRWIDAHAPQNAFVLTEDAWIGYWTPFFAMRHTWWGHQFETPDWERKQALFLSLPNLPPEQARLALEQEGITVAITSKPFAEKWQSIFAPGHWHIVASFGEQQVWMRSP